MYSGPEFGVGSVYSLNVFVEEKKMKTLLALNSVPNTAVEPPIVVAANPVVCELGVGIAHSWIVLATGSSRASLFPLYSTNQTEFPEGSNVSPVGRLVGVGIAYSVTVAGVGGA